MLTQALLEEGPDETKLREWVSMALVTPVPPATPAGFFQRLSAGDELELLHEDAWWDVELLSSQRDADGVKYHVRARGLKTIPLPRAPAQSVPRPLPPIGAA